MTVVLMTGFPGFLGSALLPRLPGRSPQARAVCLVQPYHRAQARDRVVELEATHTVTTGRIDLHTGDLTAPGLGLDAAARSHLDRVTEAGQRRAVAGLSRDRRAARPQARDRADGTRPPGSASPRHPTVTCARWTSS